MKFELGDVVRYVYDGSIGTIVVIDTHDGLDPYAVTGALSEGLSAHDDVKAFFYDWGVDDLDRFIFIEGFENSDYTNIRWLCDEDLEHARIANTEIARKLYPHYKEDGDWLIMEAK
jgi:hypothetical protein